MKSSVPWRCSVWVNSLPLVKLTMDGRDRSSRGVSVTCRICKSKEKMFLMSLVLCSRRASSHPGGDLYRHSRWRRLHTKPLFSKQLLSFHFPSLYISTQSSRSPSCPPPFGSPWAQLVNPRALRSVQAQPSENTRSLLLRWRYDDMILQILTGSLTKLSDQINVNKKKRSHPHMQ